VIASGGPATDIQGVLDACAASTPEIPVLLIAAEATPDWLIGILARGVDDFVVEPANPTDVVVRLRRMMRPQSPGEDVRSRLKARLGRHQLIGYSRAFLEATQWIPVFAKYEGTVLIEGETGTGKSICARALHYLSPRSGKPFINVNCGAIPTTLIENELFGHARGAFTGAISSQVGLVQQSEGGTLFLDEIDCLPLSAQVKLLHLLQDREYRQIGSVEIRRADVRLIAASNTDVRQAVRGKRLREDLYYRLNVLPLKLPPLRERSWDVVELATHFLKKYARRMGRPVPSISPGGQQRLLEHDWPGNVRELEHVIERALVMSEDRAVITCSDLCIEGQSNGQQLSFRQAKTRAIENFERHYIEGLLTTYRGNITHAANAAQKNRRAFWELIRKHGISAEGYRAAPG
jgi:DNA-binding NtrC family response regulator